MKTAPFEQGAKKVINTTKDMVGQAKSAVSSFTGTVGIAVGSVAAAAGAAVATISSLVESIGAIDDIGDAAGALGMGVEAFQAYKFAAMDAGVSAQGFETAIKKMENAVADAAEGGAAAKVFDKLNIDVAKFKSLAPENQLSVIADRLQGVTNQADRAQIATDLFGRDGVKMLGLLEGGAAALGEKMASAQEKFVLSESDIKTAGAADTAMKTLGATLEGIWNKLAVAIAPAVEDVAKSFTDWLVDNKPMIEGFTMFIGELASGMVELGRNILWVVENFTGMGLIIKATKSIWDSTWGKSPQQDQKASIRAQFDAEKARIEDAFKAGKINDAGRDKAFKDLFNIFGKSGVITASDVQGASTPQKSDEDKQAAAIEKAMRTPFEIFEDRTKELDTLFKAGKLSRKVFDRAMADAKSQLDKAVGLGDVKDIKPAEPPKPKRFGIAESPQALDRGSEAIAQFVRNQQATDGDPMRQLMKEQHREQIDVLQGIKNGIDRGGQAKAMF